MTSNVAELITFAYYTFIRSRLCAEHCIRCHLEGILLDKEEGYSICFYLKKVYFPQICLQIAVFGILFIFLNRLGILYQIPEPMMKLFWNFNHVENIFCICEFKATKRSPHHDRKWVRINHKIYFYMIWWLFQSMAWCQHSSLHN